MNAFDVVAVLVAGWGAGFVSTAIGAGSLVSFPILIGIGIPPVVANASNSVGLVPGNLSGIWGYRRELRGTARMARAIVVTTVIGAVVGALLLLRLPSSAFESIVPFLILFASLLVGGQPFLSRWLARRAARRGLQARENHGSLPKPLMLASGVLGIYGGYFGAAQGVILLGFMAIGIAEPLQTINALKNVAIAAANVAATCVFLFVAPLDWAVVALVAAGSIIGGLLGAAIGRRLPDMLFRVLVVTMGVVVGLWMLLD